MKYFVILGDGMADEPIAALKGKTPLEVAHTPNFDWIASHGELGLVKTVPEGMTPASDAANLSVMGYHPGKFYSGRSPLEAVSMGIPLKTTDVSFRCNLVTLSDEEPYEKKRMVDHSSDEISTGEAKILMEAIEKAFGNSSRKFYPGRSYRHALIWDRGSEQIKTTPPHDILEQPIGKYFPQGDHAEEILDMTRKSFDLLDQHPVNQRRREKGLRPANSIWVWGEGHKPALTDFREKYGIRGCVISAVDLILGIGICAGLKPIEVEGATGNLHTNYEGKARAALDALIHGSLDFAYIHIEAPDECGHRNEMENKIKAIENIDRLVAGTLRESMESLHLPWSVMVLPDHPTPLRLRTHTSDPVPFAIYRSTHPGHSADTHRLYSETSAGETGIYLPEGDLLMDRFIHSHPY